MGPGRGPGDRGQQHTLTKTSFLSPQVLPTPTPRNSRTGRPCPEGPRGPRIRDAVRVARRPGPPPPSAAATCRPKSARPWRSSRPGSSTKWTRCRWSWTSCGRPGAPSCRCPPAARSPRPRSAPGSAGSWRTRGPTCTGPSPPSTPCSPRSPGPPVSSPARPVLRAISGRAPSQRPRPVPLVPEPVRSPRSRLLRARGPWQHLERPGARLLPTTQQKSTCPGTSLRHGPGNPSSEVHGARFPADGLALEGEHTPLLLGAQITWTVIDWDLSSNGCFPVSYEK